MREGPDVAKSLPCWLSLLSLSKLRQLTEQRPRNVRMKEREQHFSFISKAEFFIVILNRCICLLHGKNCNKPLGMIKNLQVSIFFVQGC